MAKKIKYVVEDQDSTTEITKSEVPKSSGMMAYEKITSTEGQYQENFINMLCDGIGTTLMDVVVYDKQSGEEKFKFPMRVLSIMEEQEILTKAADELNKLPELHRSIAMLEMITARLRVRKALCKDHLAEHPECGEETIKRMTRNQILSLHRKYDVLAELISPCLDRIEQEDLDDLIKKLRADSSLVTKLPRQYLEEILKSFLKMLEELRMDNNSIG